MSLDALKNLLFAGGPGSGWFRDKGHVSTRNPFETFVSPNVRENTKLSDALSMLKSKRHKSFLHFSKNLLHKYAKGSVHSAVGVWADGAENSAELRLKTDSATQQYLSALLGKAAKQKAVLNWTPDSKGPHALYEISAKTSIKDLHNKLAAAHVDFHTLTKTNGVAHAIILDQDHTLGRKVGKLSKENNYDTVRRFGKGTFLGSWDSREEGEAEYNKVIADYESKHPQLAYRGSTRLAAGSVRQRAFADNRQRPFEVSAGGPGSGRYPKGSGKKYQLKFVSKLKGHTTLLKAPSDSKAILAMHDSLFKHGYEYSHTKAGRDFFFHPDSFRKKEDFIRVHKGGWYTGPDTKVKGKITGKGPTSLERHLAGKENPSTKENSQSGTIHQFITNSSNAWIESGPVINGNRTYYNPTNEKEKLKLTVSPLDEYVLRDYNTGKIYSEGKGVHELNKGMSVAYGYGTEGVDKLAPSNMLNNDISNYLIGKNFTHGQVSPSLILFKNTDGDQIYVNNKTGEWSMVPANGGKSTAGNTLKALQKTIDKPVEQLSSKQKDLERTEGVAKAAGFQLEKSGMLVDLWQSNTSGDKLYIWNAKAFKPSKWSVEDKTGHEVASGEGSASLSAYFNKSIDKPVKSNIDLKKLSPEQKEIHEYLTNSSMGWETEPQTPGSDVVEYKTKSKGYSDLLVMTVGNSFYIDNYKTSLNVAYGTNVAELKEKLAKLKSTDVYSDQDLMQKALFDSGYEQTASDEDTGDKMYAKDKSTALTKASGSYAISTTVGHAPVTDSGSGMTAFKAHLASHAQMLKVEKSIERTKSAAQAAGFNSVSNDSYIDTFTNTSGDKLYIWNPVSHNAGQWTIEDKAGQEKQSGVGAASLSVYLDKKAAKSPAYKSMAVAEDHGFVVSNTAITYTNYKNANGDELVIHSDKGAYPGRWTFSGSDSHVDKKGDDAASLETFCEKLKSSKPSLDQEKQHKLLIDNNFTHELTTDDGQKSYQHDNGTAVVTKPDGSFYYVPSGKADGVKGNGVDALAKVLSTNSPKSKQETYDGIVSIAKLHDYVLTDKGTFEDQFSHADGSILYVKNLSSKLTGGWRMESSDGDELGSGRNIDSLSIYLNKKDGKVKPSTPVESFSTIEDALKNKGFTQYATSGTGKAIWKNVKSTAAVTFDPTTGSWRYFPDARAYSAGQFTKSGTGVGELAEHLASVPLKPIASGDIKPLHDFEINAAREKIAELYSKYSGSNKEQFSMASIEQWGKDFAGMPEHTAASSIAAADGKGLYPELFAHFGLSPKDAQMLASKVSSWQGSSSQNLRIDFAKAVSNSPDADKALVLEHEITVLKLKKLHPDGKVTLYRGLDKLSAHTPEQKEAVAALQHIGKSLQYLKQAQKSIGQTTMLKNAKLPHIDLGEWHIELTSGGADSWTVAYNAAKNNFASSDGVVLEQRDVPVEQIFTTKATSPGLMTGFANEQEYIVAPKNGFYDFGNDHTTLHAAQEPRLLLKPLSIGGVTVDLKTKKITIDLDQFNANWLHERNAKKNIQAGGPGSGRHKGFGSIEEKPLFKVHMKLRTDDTEAKLADQRKQMIDQYRKNQKEGRTAKGHPILSDKQKLAVKSVVTASKAHQDKAEEIERLVAKHTAGEHQPNNKPFDVTVRDHKGKLHAIEVKTLLLQHNDKITMKKDAIDRKKAWAKEHKAVMHTMAIDLRGKKPVIYHRQGVGAYRLGKMTNVGSTFQSLHGMFN